MPQKILARSLSRSSSLLSASWWRFSRSQSSFRSTNSPETSEFFRRGVTLIEILVTLGIFVILIGIGLPTVSNYFRISNEERARSIVTDAFREAQLRAMGSDGNQPWGIHITQNAIYVFPGTVFSAPSATAYALPDGTSLTASFTDTVFSQNRGLASNVGTVTLTSTTTSQILTLYATGILSQQ